MPRNRPPTSGYARIAQAEEEEEQEAEQLYTDDEHPFQDPTTLSASAPGFAPIQPSRRDRMQIPSTGSSPRRPRRRRTNSGVDIKAINQRLERWADEIKDRFKIRRVKGRSAQDERLEIYSSVFQAPEGIRPATKAILDDDYDDSSLRMSKLEFDDQVESVRTAIELGMHPKLIAQGSSGSYFARNSGGKVIGVFKPKDEEPYASKNPKWTKWIHRNLLPFAFGRACLIPNLSYVSEAAAYILDCQLRTNIVPYTDVVSLSSKSFHYDYFERRAFYRKHKPLPEKPGSFQVFLKGFKGATEFLKEHPWPDQHSSAYRDPPTRKPRRIGKENCLPGHSSAPVEDSGDEEDGFTESEQTHLRQEFWSEELQQSFREELEKLVILDYIMRNTDRGTDNWMIRIDREEQAATIVKRPRNGEVNTDSTTYDRREESMTTASPRLPETATPMLGAIDNSLSWPWKHPDAWRSYPFGWLFLPVNLIGRPFSEKTRKHFIPLLTSKDWWIDTQVKLRQCFELDADFQEKMYARQIAVMKGQAWNVVETLKTPDHGPLELTRRTRVLVWDDVVDIPVAVPLTRPSADLRRAAGAQPLKAPKDIAEEEEMDIAASRANEQRISTDLLGLAASPPLEPAQNPFNVSREDSSSQENIARKTKNFAPTSISQSAPRPGALRSVTGNRMSYEGPRAEWYSPGERRRRFSFASIGRSHGYDDDEDGDLGYAAANDQEGSRRKVIVERLEMVTSKPPLFSWC
ncbi:Hypothetical protein R9X50_00079100 [Acrodontium crateriforme]|uniref:Phosphatidylinositol 4-kinase n=1 Tax=Acrodontium crateriforme TaxID=150365 RepID=A0AAQ3LYH9_9PEZI|nr:Hypothetical protein R9X50_00079100 [Acrodontium crateriforme]